jgi:hypothetical protein
VKTPAPLPAPLEPLDGQSAVVGNERTTALAGAALLVLILVELVTVPVLRALLGVHVFVGVLLAGPLAVKLASTGSRFVRYYRGSPAFVRKGPPRPALRVLAPLLVLTTLVLLGSGIGLLVTGPTHPGPVLFLHGISFVLWLPMVAVHLLAYLRRVLRLIGDDWRKRRPEPASPRRVRLGVNLAALLIGALAAILALGGATPWTAWLEANGSVPGPFVAGALIAVLAVLATRPLRWEEIGSTPGDVFPGDTQETIRGFTSRIPTLRRWR